MSARDYDAERFVMKFVNFVLGFGMEFARDGECYVYMRAKGYDTKIVWHDIC